MTSKILGVAAVVFVRFVCGLDWIPSLFLYFPFHALARSIAELGVRRRRARRDGNLIYYSAWKRL